MDDAPIQPTPVSAPPARPTEPAPPPPAAMEYDRSGNHVTRGQFRILLILMFINTVAIVGYLAVPGGSQWARQSWKDFEAKRAAKAKEKLQRDAIQKRVDDFQAALPALAAMKLPADKPVYTEDGIEAAALLASDPSYDTVRIDRQGMESSLWQAAVVRDSPPEATPLERAITSEGGGSGRGGFVFVHERKNPAGERRLVWCEIIAQQQAQHASSDRYTVKSHRSLRVRLIAPGSATEPPKRIASVITEFDQGSQEQSEVKLKGPAKTPQVFRLLPGVPDENDPTRFTIPYVISGASGAFRVRVLAGDRLVVEPSDGRIAERSGDTLVTQKWDAPGPQGVRTNDELSSAED